MTRNERAKVTQIVIRAKRNKKDISSPMLEAVGRAQLREDNEARKKKRI
jgi:hypothetical protein